MEYALSFKNRRLRVWLWIMIPAFLLTFGLFVYLPKEFNFEPVLPLIWLFLLLRLGNCAEEKTEITCSSKKCIK
ncbi:hypothetical protein [Saliterribacillus persicus]|uniref:Uncharacterized protein n=1 Tax=Saliterribacillus persicus TaxID=930114 RepID=A0A368X5R7_9BACI|nr:hypothetical protein [Saliterribacillus persicus]RCW63361.1 hypothetical protein DFR57_11828 [Saliterribacillus persicus]